MPVLRSPPDNTLSETLGNLGSSLTNAFNPLNTIRAQNLQSEIQQRNWEIQQKQSIDAANKNAANVFYNSDLPFDPATKEMIAAGLRSGTLGVNNYIDALTKTGSLKANQTAAQMYAATHADLPPEELASDQAQILQGKSSSEIDAQRATTKLTGIKTDQTAAGVAAAQTPAAKEAAALGQPLDATQLDAGNTLLNQPPITGALGDPDVQKQIDRTTILRGQAKIPVTTDMPVSSGLAAPTAQAAVTKQNIIEQSKPRSPDLIVPAVPPTDVLTGQPVPQAQPAPPADGSTPPTPAPPPVGVVSQTRQGPDVPATQATEGGKTTAHEVAAGDVKVLDQAISESGAAQSMKSKLSQLKDLADALDTSGAGLSSRVLRTLAEYNIHPGDIGATYAAIQQIINAEIPDVRQKAGIQRLAGPAIKEEQLILGTANMPKKTLMNIIANEEAAADQQISRANLAYQARSGQMPMSEYYKQSLALDATIKAHTDELRKPYKAVGTESQQPASTETLPQSQPLNTGSAADAFRALLAHLGLGGSQTQPPQGPAPVPTGPTPAPPTQRFDIQNGTLVPLGP